GRPGPSRRLSLATLDSSRTCISRSRTYPDIKVEVLVGDGFDVKADGRYCRDNFTNLQSTLSAPCAGDSHVPALVRIPSVCTTESSCPRCPVGGGGPSPVSRRVLRDRRGVGRPRTRPRIRILISFFAHNKLDSHDMPEPIFAES